MESVTPEQGRRRRKHFVLVNQVVLRVFQQIVINLSDSIVFEKLIHPSNIGCSAHRSPFLNSPLITSSHPRSRVTIDFFEELGANFLVEANVHVVSMFSITIFANINDAF